MARQWLMFTTILGLAALTNVALANPTGTQRDANQRSFDGGLSSDQSPSSSATGDLLVREAERQATEDGVLNTPKSLNEIRLASIFDQNEELQALTDYHPTVDRWTDRDNRIRVKMPISWLLYSGELDVKPNVGIGLSISWEAPGFIAIFFEGMISPFSRLEVKPGASLNPRSSRHAEGFTANAYLSIAIFNPELSNEDLALWAGVGAGAWYFNFNDDSTQNSIAPSDVEFQDTVPAAKVFFEIDYRVTPNIHVGFGTALHVLYARFTDDGRFYKVNGISGGVGLGGALTQENRNEGFLGHLALVTDIHLNLSVVF